MVIFLVVGGVVGQLVSSASRRSVEAAHARAEAETLAAMSGTLSAADDPLPQLAAQLRTAFEADSVAVLVNDEHSGWSVVASAGEPVPTRPEEGDLAVSMHGGATLVLTGQNAAEEDPDILRAFAGQVAMALEQRELREVSARAVGLEEANELRTALLAAVSHDLRTPLSSIKASVSSLLQRDVDFTPDATHELLETIDEGADRLNHLIGNLLDMSRLQTGALQLVMRDVGLEEIVPAALGGLTQPGRVEVDVPETLPRVRADAALLERAVANVIENAIDWSPDHVPVRVEACVAQDRVDLPRRRPRSGDPAVAARGSVPAVPTARRQFERQWRRARARCRARVRRGDGRGDCSGRHSRWRRHHDRQLGGGEIVSRVLVVDDEPQILRARDQPARAATRWTWRPTASRRSSAPRASIPTWWCSTSVCPGSTASTSSAASRMELGADRGVVGTRR